MEIKEFEMSDIYSDSNFNIRGEISQTDIVELARNIEVNGLLQPISVQPYDKMPGYKYRIVVGHRRFAAFVYLNRKTIPCILKENLSDIQAYTLNFVENINRKDLNKLQEAKGIERYVKLGLTLEEISRLTNQGIGWIQVRVSLLKLPDLIQLEAAAGFLTDNQIKDLAMVRGTESQLQIVKSIKEAKFRGDKRLPTIREKKKNPTKLARRNSEEVYDMIEHIIDTFGISNVASRSLAWVNGEISDAEYDRDLKEYAESLGITTYQSLDHVKDLMEV